MCFSIVSTDKSKEKTWNCVFTEAFLWGTIIVLVKFAEVWQSDLIESYSIEILTSLFMSVVFNWASH